MDEREVKKLREVDRRGIESVREVRSMDIVKRNSKPSSLAVGLKTL